MTGIFIGRSVGQSVSQSASQCVFWCRAGVVLLSSAGRIGLSFRCVCEGGAGDDGAEDDEGRETDECFGE